MISLKLRHEFKYLLHPEEYLKLRELLKKMMQADEHSKSAEGYHIRSLYFDDLYNTALMEKQLGYSLRNKYRIRIYDFSEAVINLEIKEKYGDYIQKKSALITKQEYERIYQGNIAFLHQTNSEVKERYFLEMRNSFLRPKVIVDYQREAYILPYNQVRITFDKYLSAGRPSLDIFDQELVVHQVGQEYMVILEVKYNNFLPSHLSLLLRDYCRNRLAISKYVICREYFERR